MKKKILMFATVATLAVVMTACGSAQTSNNPTPTVEPTKAVEATTAPTATSTPTVEPTTEPTVEPTATSTPTPEPTATPVPTSTPTPEPTSTPVPTEAPVVETGNWETVLRELHALTTYAEREAYIETLDKSKYEVAAVDNFDLIAIPNRTEFVEREGMEEYITTKDTLLDPKLEGMYLAEILNYDEYVYDDVDEYYLMTITNLATGETDPWGVKFHTELYDWETGETVAGPVVTWTVETLVEKTSKFTDELNSYRDNQYAYIETWDTKKYYAE